MMSLYPVFIVLTSRWVANNCNISFTESLSALVENSIPDFFREELFSIRSGQSVILIEHDVFNPTWMKSLEVDASDRLKAQVWSEVVAVE